MGEDVFKCCIVFVVVFYFLEYILDGCFRLFWEVMWVWLVVDVLIVVFC